MITSKPTERANPGYETTDAETRPIWIAAGGLVVTVAVVVLGISLMFSWLHERDVAQQQRTRVDRVTAAVADTRPQFPEPRLQVAPQVDLATLRAHEDEELKTYGWVDRKVGVVRIPIDRAMDLLVRKGLPVRGDPNAPKPTLTPLDMQQTRPLQRQPISQAPLQEVK
ncbi:MAG TPA: hypothetical protein VGM54_05900 [Chthoniobacter sp.]|jgi:hypothetical protein